MTALRVELDSPVRSARLVGPRCGGRRRAGRSDASRFPLLASRWGSPPLALPSGDYRLSVDGSTRVSVSRCTTGRGARRCTACAPTRSTADSSCGSVRRCATARARRGRACGSCSTTCDRAAARRPSGSRASTAAPPLTTRSASTASLARTRPELRRYWSVVDGSVAVPDGAIRVIEGSAAVVAQPGRGAGAGRERLAALGLPSPPRSARAADLARHDAQGARPRPSGHEPAPALRDHPAGLAVERAARAELLQRADLPHVLRLPRSDLGDRLPAQRRARRHRPRATGAHGSRCRRRSARRAVRADLARRPRRDGRLPRSGPVRRRAAR